MTHRVVLVTPSSKSHRTAEETIALGYLASVLRESGYEAVIIDGWLRLLNSHEIVDLIANRCTPAVVCVSCYRSNMEEAGLIVAEIKNRLKNIPVICGGYGPTFHDNDFLDVGFDVVVRGEAEHIISKLVTNLITGKSIEGIPGVSFRRNGKTERTNRGKVIDNLDDIPYAARDELQYSINRKNPVHLCTSRGCNGHCSFCSIFSFTLGASKNKRWRQRSINNIADEIESLYHKFGTAHFKIVDDSFLEPPRNEQWSYEFAEALRKRNLQIQFRTQVRADRITRNIAANLRSCGWFATAIGIENFSDSALRRMRKSATNADNILALEILQEYGVFAQAGLIMFDQHTTMQELEENCIMLGQCKWVVTKGIFTEMFAAEGTVFTKQLQKKGLIKKNQKNQNAQYVIQDPLVRRVYVILREWHKSHAQLYDWVIDSITAPKIMTNRGYCLVHKLCIELLAVDVEIMRSVLDYVSNSPAVIDKDYIGQHITSRSKFYNRIKADITKIYRDEGLYYKGVLNPFLN